MISSQRILIEKLSQEDIGKLYYGTNIFYSIF